MNDQYADKVTRSVIERYAGTVALSAPIVFVMVRVAADTVFDVEWPPIWVFLPVVFVSLALVVLFFVARARTRRLLRQIDYRMCLRCRQSLLGLPDEGTCPECGCPYVLDRQKMVWMDEYRLP